MLKAELLDIHSYPLREVGETWVEVYNLRVGKRQQHLTWSNPDNLIIEEKKGKKENEWVVVSVVYVGVVMKPDHLSHEILDWV